MKLKEVKTRVYLKTFVDLTTTADEDHLEDRVEEDIDIMLAHLDSFFDELYENIECENTEELSRKTAEDDDGGYPSDYDYSPDEYDQAAAGWYDSRINSIDRAHDSAWRK